MLQNTALDGMKDTPITSTALLRICTFNKMYPLLVLGRAFQQSSPPPGPEDCDNVGQDVEQDQEKDALLDEPMGGENRSTDIRMCLMVIAYI